MRRLSKREAERIMAHDAPVLKRGHTYKRRTMRRLKA